MLKDHSAWVPLLIARQKEVADIMVTLYGQEKVMDIHDYNIRMESREEGLQQGLQEGIHRGQEQGISAMISTLKKINLEKSFAVQEVTHQFILISN